MTTAYTSLLGLALPVTGELSGTWGDTVNNSITSLLDSAVAGTTNVSTDGDVTLTTTTGAANTAREAILLFSGARTALRTVTAPAQSKIYTVINATTGGFSVKLVGSGPTTGLTIPNGASAVVAWNGSDFVEVGAGSIGNLVVNGTLTVTGATTLQSTLAVTGNITNTAGTANGVAYLNGSKVVTSGSALTFDGSQFYVNSNSTTASGFFQINDATTTQANSFGTIVRNANDGNGRYSLSAWRAQNASGLTQYAYIGAQSISGASNYTPELVFGLSTGASSYAEQMRLTSTGLGIGTSSPAYKLDVVGSGLFTVSGGNQSIILNTSNNAQNYNGLINFQRQGSVKFYAALDSSDNLAFLNSSASNLLTLDSSGNLGLGVTPSAWGSGFKAFQTSYMSIAATGAGSGDASISWNAYNNGTNWIYQYTGGVSTRYRQNESGHAWFTAPSGTAGNAITFTQAMTLDASGNLGIGTTSPINRLTLLTATTGNVTAMNWSDGATDTGYLGIRSGGGVGLWAGGFLAFGSGSSTFTERARIDSSGNFLVGTTSSNLSSASRGVIEVNGASTAYIGLDTGGTLRGTFYSNGSIVGLATATLPLTFGTTGGTEWGRFDSSGNLFIGGTSTTTHPALNRYVSLQSQTNNDVVGYALYVNEGVNSRRGSLFLDDSAGVFGLDVTAGSGVPNIVFRTAGTEHVRILSSDGNLLVGTTTNFNSDPNWRQTIQSSLHCLGLKTTASTSYINQCNWHASTSGNPTFIEFATETTFTARGTISYNRASGLVAYNTTSDYRAKDISGPVTNSGALIDSTPVYMGKMKGATQERPMFIAHETPAYAHTGLKDAVDEDGNPVYQQMDASALIPVMWAEIQSLRKRLADAGL